jgi:hypothetical protein
MVHLPAHSSALPPTAAGRPGCVRAAPPRGCASTWWSSTSWWSRCLSAWPSVCGWAGASKTTTSLSFGPSRCSAHTAGPQHGSAHASHRSSRPQQACRGALHAGHSIHLACAAARQGATQPMQAPLAAGRQDRTAPVARPWRARHLPPATGGPRRRQRVCGDVLHCERQHLPAGHAMRLPHGAPPHLP